MANTYGELILEYQNFEYSKENYELTKECYELQLMSQYLENQQFMIENMIEIKEEFQEFDESYFIENASDEALESMMETADKKSKNIFKRIWNGFKSLWKKIAGFFSKLLGRSKKTSEKNAELKEALEKLPDEVINAALNPSAAMAVVKDTVDTAVKVAEDVKNKVEDIKTSKTVSNGEIKKILDNAWKVEYQNDGLVIASNQPFAKNINSRVLHNKKHKHALDMLAVALSDTEVIIKTTGEKKVMSIDDLLVVFQSISELSNESNEKGVTEIKKYIKDALHKVASRGVVIKVDPDSMESTKAKIDEISNKMSELMNESVDTDIFIEASNAQRKRDKKMAQQMAGGAKPTSGEQMSFKDFKNKAPEEVLKVKNVTTGVTGLKDIYSEVMVITGNMMKLYNNIESYRAAVGKGLSTYLNSKSVSSLVKS